MRPQPQQVGWYYYLTAVGLAGETLRWHGQLQHELRSMTMQATRAVEQQAASVEAQVAAEEWASTAAEDETTAAALQAQAQVLEEDVQTKEAAVAAHQAQAAQEAQVAADETAQAQAHGAKAVLEEEVAKEEWAASAELAETAATQSAEAEADEGAVVLCQLIPLLDVVCDVVGGFTATTLELAAATEAAQATADLVLAQAAQEQTKVEGSLAVDFSAEATAQAAEAAAAQQAAAELQEQAALEAAELVQDEAASQAKWDESAVEWDAAAVDEATATKEEVAAEQALAASLRHGIQAVGYAVLQMATALLLVGVVFMGRLVRGFVLPCLVSFSFLLSSSLSSSSPASLALTSPARRLSVDTGHSQAVHVHDSSSDRPDGLWSLAPILFSISAVLHAVILFVLVQSCYYDHLLFWKPVSQTIVGGTIVQLSLATTLLQTFLLHIPPLCFLLAAANSNHHTKTTWWRILFHWVLDVLLLGGWNVFGFILLVSQPGLLAQSVVVYGLGPLVLGTLLLHHRLYYQYHQHHPQSRRHDAAAVLPKIDENDNDLGKSQPPQEIMKNLATEATPLLENDADVVEHESRDNTKEKQEKQQQSGDSSSLVALRHSVLFDLLVTLALCSVVWGCWARSAILAPFWAPAKHVWRIWWTAHWKGVVRWTMGGSAVVVLVSGILLVTTVGRRQSSYFGGCRRVQGERRVVQHPLDGKSTARLERVVGQDENQEYIYPKVSSVAT